MSNAETYDVIVIGAGIAGAGVAAELASDCKVLVLEMENQPGYHSTGRSAAVYSQIYGPEAIRALTRASEAFFRAPPPDFGDQALLLDSMALLIATEPQMAHLQAAYDALKGENSVSLIDGHTARDLMPLLRAEYVAGALVDAAFADIDVHGLHQGYLRQFRARGGRVSTHCEVLTLTRNHGLWSVETRVGTFLAPIVVNAAGAWADQIGDKAGAEHIGLVPKRRTCILVQPPQGMSTTGLPLVTDIDESFYVKGDAGRLLLSPANEDLDTPCDVQPNELDIAICVDRVERVFDLQVRRIENSWAGLRSFVPDKTPVVGFSDRVDGFFWLAGQGGYGIQTAPALSRFAASAILKSPVPHDLVRAGFNPAMVAVNRLQSHQPDTEHTDDLK